MKANRKVIIQASVVLAGIVLMGVKFAAWWLTNSNAILTDALESIINVVAGFFALYSLWLASKPRDENHPYGHGKIEFLAAGFEGSLIFTAGVLIIGKAAYNLRYPQEIQAMDLGLVLTAFSGGLNYIMGYMLVREGKKERSLTLESDGHHLLSDAYSSAGIILGMGLYLLLGFVWLDSLTALLFGVFILYTGYRLMRGAISGIMDEADPTLIYPLVQIMEQHRKENWIDVHNLRIIRYGASIHIDGHLTVPWYFTVEQGHAEVKQLEQVIQQQQGAPVELFIHADPCRPPLACKICIKSDCQHRHSANERVVHWTPEHLLFHRNHHEI
jgi:cation diffusion facilitator family transporter